MAVALSDKKSKIRTDVIRSVRGGKGEKFSHFIVPMMAQLHTEPFDDPNWIFEIKWDGYRAVAEVSRSNVRLYSRNGLSFSQLYPTVVEALKKIKDDVVLDGEIVVLDKNNRPSFQKLQQYGDNHSLPLLYYVFDCLSYKGKDITDLPLLERKKIAERVIPKSSGILKYADHVEGMGKDFFNNVVKMDIEGMIAKRANSLYTPGKRTGDWLKIKHHNTQEAIIAGYTAPRGSRSYFGALLLGIRSGNTLRYIGHTGTGFTENILKEVYQKLQPLVRNTSPFDRKIPVNSAVTWVAPELVCEIKFAEETDEGILRQPVFMGLRIDKSAKEANQLDRVVSAKTKRKTEVTKRSVSKKLSPKKKEDDAANPRVKIDNHVLQLTNLTKMYWPDNNITKGELIGYYASIGKYILPYLKDRPQSLKRNPNGITDKGFFHKDAGDEAPSWVKSKPIYSESTDKDVDYIICNDQATLTYLNNLGCIEINPWNSTTRHLDKPDYLIMDIDPSEGNTFDQVIETVQAVKEVLDRAGVKGYCKTSGATGLHVYIPLYAQYTYDQTRPFAELIAVLTHHLLPDTTTVERMLNKRKGRIYIDFLQNRRGQTLASVYSARPVPGASVSAPLEWKEVKPGLHPNDFTIFNMLKRIEKKGDLFANVLKEKTDITKAIRMLEK